MRKGKKYSKTTKIQVSRLFYTIKLKILNQCVNFRQIYRDSTGKIQNMGNFAGRRLKSLQQVKSKGKKREGWG